MMSDHFLLCLIKQLSFSTDTVILIPVELYCLTASRIILLASSYVQADGRQIPQFKVVNLGMK